MHHRNVVLRHSCCLLGGLLFFSQAGLAQIPGCTDPLALNYNAAATQNDGSCQYASAVITPVFSYILPKTLI